MIIIILLFVSLALLVFACATLFTFVYASWRGAPWVPTKNKDIGRFLKLANIRAGEKMYDLGCGDGRILCAAGKEGAIAYGFEIALFPFILAQLRRLFQRNKKRIKISYRDIWNVDLSEADIIYFFLMPKVYPRLKMKFENELRNGARIITSVWPIEGWEPAAVDSADDSFNLYLYFIS